MNTLNYKGFIGSVEFSEEDNVFFGKIEGIDGLVNFEGESVRELTDSFHEAVEDYLAYCAEENIPLHKSYTGKLNINISPTVHSQIVALAKKAGITVDAFIEHTLEKEVREDSLASASL